MNNIEKEHCQDKKGKTFLKKGRIYPNKKEKEEHFQEKTKKKFLINLRVFLLVFLVLPI